MDRSQVPALLVITVVLVLLAGVLGACRTTVPPAGPPYTTTVTVEAPAGPPAPTRMPPTPTASPPATAIPFTTPPPAPTAALGPVAWTLTILHTGEVYGDVLPCG